MTDPKRWSETGEADELERDLLRAGQAARMPESERRALWAGIALSLPVLPPPASATPGPAVGASGLSPYLTKGLIFLAAVTGVTLGVTRLWPSPKPMTKPAEVVLAMPAVPAPTLPPAASQAATPPAEPPPAAAEQPSDGKPRLAPASQLREESIALLQARTALRAGDAARSLALLERARVRFARGALGQEREALTIQALAQSGERASARRRAQAFLRAHPQSPYVADVRLVAAP